MFLIVMLISVGVTPAGAAQGYDVSCQAVGPETVILDFSLGEVKLGTEVDRGKSFTTIEFDGNVTTRQKGFAQLPFLHASVKLPPNHAVVMETISEQYVDHVLDHPLLPSKGVLYRNQDPDLIPYWIDPISDTDHWYPCDIAITSAPFIFRDVRGTNVYVYPFQYNARRKLLRVYTQVRVKLSFIPQDEFWAVNPLREENQGAVTRDMDAIYRSLFINYDDSGDDAEAIGEAGEMLVIYTPRDEDAIQPYLQWKREKGLRVHTSSVAAGTNVKSIIQEAYAANPNLLYVQLVGDWEDLKSDMGTSQNAPMDPMLGCVAGSDNYPDIIVGRFPANSPEDAAAQTAKAIAYEKNPDMTGGWYRRGLGIGSGEGAGSGDDGEADFKHIDIIKANRLLPSTYDEVAEAYKHAGANVVADTLNSGAGVINYCGHGSETSWVTTGFGNSHVNALTNGDALPVIFSVACMNGVFHRTGTCFAESWLRKKNGGAVAALMATINQPWQPPMRGQDYFNDLLIGGYDYAVNPGNGTSTFEGRTSIGSIVLNGLTLMYAESSNSGDLETIQTWTLFGDASLQLRTDNPLPVSLSDKTVQTNNPFSVRVSNGGIGIENAMVALSQNGVVYSGLTDGSGDVLVPHSLSPGSAVLVVTGFNLATLYEEVTVIDQGGPNPTETVAFDGFESNTFTGGDGWLDRWNNQGRVVRIKMNPYEGTRYVKIMGGPNAGSLERAVDLSNFSSARLQFAGRVNSFEKQDKAYVKVSPDGVNYTVVAEFTPADSDNVWHLQEIDLSAFEMSADFRIVFEGAMSRRINDKWYLDNIEIVGQP